MCGVWRVSGGKRADLLWLHLHVTPGFKLEMQAVTMFAFSDTAISCKTDQSSSRSLSPFVPRSGVTMVTKCAPAPPRSPCHPGSHFQYDLEGDIHTYNVCDCAEGVKWICCREGRTGDRGLLLLLPTSPPSFPSRCAPDYWPPPLVTHLLVPTMSQTKV